MDNKALCIIYKPEQLKVNKEIVKLYDRPTMPRNATYNFK